MRSTASQKRWFSPRKSTCQITFEGIREKRGIKISVAILMHFLGVMAGLCVFGGWGESRGRGPDPGFGFGSTAATAQAFHLVDLGQRHCKGISVVQVLFINSLPFVSVEPLQLCECFLCLMI